MEPYIGELKIFAFGMIPKYWAACDGQLLAINTNQELFSVIGTQYGGNGMTTFALPDLRGRAAMHEKTVGQVGGSTGTTLKGNNLAPHVHTLMATTVAIDQSVPTNGVLGKATEFMYATEHNVGVKMAEGTITGPTGGSEPISNMQPYLGLSVCIALKGIYPPKN
jgi:microcystin-dependent protein